MKKIKSRRMKFAGILLLSAWMLVAFQSCKDDDVPEPENDEEVITNLNLVFRAIGNPSDSAVFRAVDPDGEGAQGLEIMDTIVLDTNKAYNLSIEILNTLGNPTVDIAAEVREEGAEHQIFFAFSQDAFANPAGDGNIDNAQDPLNYNDFDSNNNPIGLSSDWTTSLQAVESGMFKVRLQHQPDIKSATTGAEDGDTDFEISFPLQIK